MLFTIDSARRLVIPKRIRDRPGLRGGEQLELEEEHGTIRIARPKRRIELVETDQGS